MGLEYDFYVEGKVCPSCNEARSASDFSKNKQRPDGLQVYCKPCHKLRYLLNRTDALDKATLRRLTKREEINEYKRAAYAARKAEILFAQRAAKFGLTPTQAEALIGDGRCHLCGSPESTGKRRHHIDHDHSCCDGTKVCGNCVRGVLCHPCNTGLLPGYEALPEALRDSPSINAYLSQDRWWLRA